METLVFNIEQLEGIKIGHWIAYFDGMSGAISWNNSRREDLTVYATPGWESAENCPVDFHLNDDHFLHIEFDLLRTRSAKEQMAAYLETMGKLLTMAEAIN